MAEDGSAENKELKRSVRSRDPKQDFNKIRKTDYYANFGIEVRSNEALKKAKSSPKLYIISILAENTHQRNNSFSNNEPVLLLKMVSQVVF